MVFDSDRFGELFYNYILVGDEIQAEPDIERWCAWMATRKRLLKHHKYPHFLLSTVFLGTDHNHSSIFRESKGAPILFETMVFAREGESVYMRRYCTKQEALNSHYQLLSILVLIGEEHFDSFIQSENLEIDHLPFRHHRFPHKPQHFLTGIDPIALLEAPCTTTIP